MFVHDDILKQGKPETG